MAEPDNVQALTAGKQRKARPRADWEHGLIRNKEGAPKKFIANVLHVFGVHPAWADVLAYDAFSECVVKLRPPPVRLQDGTSQTGPWTESDSSRTAAWFAGVVGFEPHTQQVEQAVVAFAERNVVHPVQDYLRGLVWDGVKRLDTMLVKYFGAAKSPYALAVGSRWMISAVARAMEPGCQADCMLVLESAQQGVGKSTGFEALAGKDWFADTGIVVGDKDSYQGLRGKWIYEFGELDAIKGREVTRVKGFVSARSDTYRPSYGRRTRDFPRQVVFCGTTNETEYLIDRTGNRRFWPVLCSAQRVDVDGLRRDRDQLWAEARARYEGGDKWHVDTLELRRLCEEAQRQREVEDPWVPIVSAWLTSPKVSHEIKPDAGITIAWVMAGALQIDPAAMNHAQVIRTGHVLRACGWCPRQVRQEGERVRLYYPESQTAQSEPESDRDKEPPSVSAHSQASQTSQMELHAYVESEGVADRIPREDWDRDDRDTVTAQLEREAIEAEGEGKL